MDDVKHYPTGINATQREKGGTRVQRYIRSAQYYQRSFLSVFVARALSLSLARARSFESAWPARATSPAPFMLTYVVFALYVYDDVIVRYVYVCSINQLQVQRTLAVPRDGKRDRRKCLTTHNDMSAIYQIESALPTHVSINGREGGRVCWLPAPTLNT